MHNSSSLNKYVSLGACISVLPTATTFALYRAISPASETGELSVVVAVIMTQSAPCPDVKDITCSLILSAFACPVWQKFCLVANSSCCLFTSMPNTLHPAARSICTVRRPTRPRPITTTLSPTLALAIRIPCSAIVPRVVNDAYRKSNSLGTLTHKFRGMETISA